MSVALGFFLPHANIDQPEPLDLRPKRLPMQPDGRQIKAAAAATNTHVARERRMVDSLLKWEPARRARTARHVAAGVFVLEDLVKMSFGFRFVNLFGSRHP
jgi:hypothetical protein